MSAPVHDRQEQRAAGESPRTGPDSDVEVENAEYEPAPAVVGRMHVGAADDEAERQADMQAHRVVTALRAAGAPVPRPATTDTQGGHFLRRAAEVGVAGGPLAVDTERDIAGLRGRGRPLEPAVRREMESAFGGADFSGVRVSTGAAASELNDRLQAQAFTVGKDIAFRGTAPDLSTQQGQHLLAHELAHTLQPGAGAQRTVEVHRWNPFKRKQAEISAPTSVTKVDEPTGASSMWAMMTPEELLKVATNAKGTELMSLRGEARYIEACKKSLDPKQLEQVQGLLHGFSDPTDKASPEPQLRAKHTAKGRVRAGATVWKLADDNSNTGKITLKNALTMTIEGELQLEGHEGYAVNDGTTRVWVPQQDLQLSAWGKASDDAPLFKTDGRGHPTVTVEDVKQGEIGDCYLQAAIAGLVQAKPDFVIDMFRDLGKTVTVRLFEVDQSDPEKPVLSPKIVRVAKSEASRDGARLHGAGGLWVAMLQKAYTAAHFAGTAEKEVTTSTKGNSSMEDIEGGHAYFATMHLTGQAAGRTAISSGTGKQFAQRDSLPWSRAQVDLWATEMAKKTAKRSFSGIIAHDLDLAVSGNAKQSATFTTNFMRWVKTKRDKFNELFFESGHIVLGGKSKDYESEIRIDDIKKLFHDEGGAAYYPSLEAYLKKRFPGKRGSGGYTESQDQAWEKMTTALDGNKIVTLSSNKQVARGKATGSGHSGGEEMAKGLVGGHAYTVLDYKVEAGLRFVQLRNPWASYGRGYDTSGGGMKATEEKDAGTFWLELADLTKRFHSVDVGG